MDEIKRPPIKGRGAVSNVTGRFERETRVLTDDGWNGYASGGNEALTDPVRTTVSPASAKSIIARNQSPDVAFDQSVNPYQGCEHACIYCFARPTHAYLNLSPGLDFETKLFAKRNAAELLAKELRAKSYVCQPLALGANTDAYQPVERTEGITLRVLEVCRDFNQPVSIITKSALVLRDLELDRVVHRLADALQQPVERVGLGQVARITVEDEAAAGVGPREAVLEHAQQDLV